MGLGDTTICGVSDAASGPSMSVLGTRKGGLKAEERLGEGWKSSKQRREGGRAVKIYRHPAPQPCIGEPATGREFGICCIVAQTVGIIRLKGQITSPKKVVVLALSKAWWVRWGSAEDRARRFGQSRLGEALTKPAKLFPLCYPPLDFRRCLLSLPVSVRYCLRCHDA